MWLALARAREHGHPLEVIAVYQREIEDLIDRKQTHRYEQAVGHVVHVDELCERAGEAAGLAIYLGELRQRHKPKTKFLSMLVAAVEAS